jgi:CubicO group peptidase (beta-lactamase class C family)
MSVNVDLDLYFQDLEVKNKFSGVVLITQGEQRLYTGAFGYASRSWKVPNSLEIRYDTASITKLFTAVATLQMIDQGHFDFDTGVIDFLDLEGTNISPEVNVFHLLTHTSGIGDDADEEAGEVYEDLWKTRPNYMVTTTADFLPQFVHKPPNFPPGQGCRYCNVGFVLLGLMIEKASGINYRDYVRRFIFKPARMDHSDFFHMAHANPQVAEGYDPIFKDDELVGWKRNIYSFPPIGSPDGGAQVTAYDLDRFLRSVRAGELLSPELTEAFFTPQVDYRDHGSWTQKYGYGMWFYVENGTDEVICCQRECINAGVSGMIRHYPKRDLNVVILSNMESGAWKPMRHIHDLVVDGKWDGA